MLRIKGVLNCQLESPVRLDLKLLKAGPKLTPADPFRMVPKRRRFVSFRSSPIGPSSQ